MDRSLPLPRGGVAVHVQGLSELVRHHKAIFVTGLDRVEVLRPEDTTLVTDHEAWLKQLSAAGPPYLRLVALFAGD